jgi:hypothetical protein
MCGFCPFGCGINLEDGALTVQNVGKIVQSFTSDEGDGIYISGSETVSIPPGAENVKITD